VTRYVQRLAKLTGCAAILAMTLMCSRTADAAGGAAWLCQQHVVPNILTWLSEMPSRSGGLHPPCRVPWSSVAQAWDDLALLEDTILARAREASAIPMTVRRYQEALYPREG